MEVLRSVSGVVGADFPWALSAKKRISKLVWESEKENKLFLHAFMKKKYLIFLPVDKNSCSLGWISLCKISIIIALQLSQSSKTTKQNTDIIYLLRLLQKHHLLCQFRYLDDWKCLDGGLLKLSGMKGYIIQILHYLKF